MEHLVQLAVVFAGLGLLRYLYRLLTRPSVADIPGPEPTSFWLGMYSPIWLPSCRCSQRTDGLASRAGHLPELFQEQSGETDFKWQEQYGSIVRVKAPFGVSNVMSPRSRPRAPTASRGSQFLGP